MELAELVKIDPQSIGVGQLRSIFGRLIRNTIRHVSSNGGATAPVLARANLALPLVLRSRGLDCLPFKVSRRIGSAAGERLDVISGQPVRTARDDLLQLEGDRGFAAPAIPAARSHPVPPPIRIRSNMT